ncbi:MAG: hypothetical protein LPK13_08780, partial [Marinobacter sp.]|nr:hypothetical protein [Marinobacter sp.]MDX5387217.1 hypothetical protein [Marinobacter sp.]MDX5441934.1 hypothetical protein [Alteromonadaceae bacterium]MDX5472587.1 hypothetical protein [Marinobacter sp.]
MLFYNTGHEYELDAMATLGGVDWQLLSHQDELGKSLLRVRKRCGAKLGGHALERESFAEILEPDVLFTGRELGVLVKVWWLQIETAERRFSASQKLPKGLPLRTLSRCCQSLMWNHHICRLTPWSES